MKTPSPSTPPTEQPDQSHAKRIDNPQPCTPNSCGPERIPPQWAWHHRTLTRLRSRLLGAHADHASQVSAPPDPDSNDAADAAQDYATRNIMWGALNAENERLFEVDCALQRIRDGLYGICERTGHPIAPERLRAIPWTRYSLAAAAEHEHRSS